MKLRDVVADHLERQFNVKQEYDQMPENDNGYYFVSRESYLEIADGLIPLIKSGLKRKSLKPLSELHKDEEACKDLLCFVFGYQNVDRSQLEVIYHNFKTEIYDYSNKISIWHDGAFYKYGKGSSICKIFQIVDFIRSLGYDIQPEPITP